MLYREMKQNQQGLQALHLQINLGKLDTFLCSQLDHVCSMPLLELDFIYEFASLNAMLSY